MILRKVISRHFILMAHSVALKKIMAGMRKLKSLRAINKKNRSLNKGKLIPRHLNSI